MSAQHIILIYFIISNLAALILMAIDKIRAVEHRFRIPESVLLLHAVIGGSIGAIIGMFLFHHKTRKPKFRLGLPIILMIQIILVFLIRFTASEITFM